jgi:hypothetical protein
MRATQSFINQVARLASEGRIVNGIPKNIERMALPGRDEARAELSEVGYSLWEAWALGLLLAKERYPTTFGQINDPAKWLVQLESLKTRRQTLFARIACEYQPNDIQILHTRDDGYSLVSFRVSAGAVALGPLDSAGERLTNHLLDVDPQRWGGAADEVNVPLHNTRRSSKVSSDAQQVLG